MAGYVTYGDEILIRIDRISVVKKCERKGSPALGLLIMGYENPFYLISDDTEKRDEDFRNLAAAIGADATELNFAIQKPEGQEAKESGEDEARERLLAQDLPLDTFTLKTCMAFRSLGISTIGDLIKHTRRDFLKLRHVGPKTVSEVEDFLELAGLSLAGKNQR